MRLHNRNNHYKSLSMFLNKMCMYHNKNHHNYLYKKQSIPMHKRNILYMY